MGYKVGLKLVIFPQKTRDYLNKVCYYQYKSVLPSSTIDLQL